MTSSRALALLTKACSTNTFASELDHLRDVEPASLPSLRSNMEQIGLNLLPGAKALAQAQLDVGAALALSKERPHNIEACEMLDQLQREGTFGFEVIFWIAIARLHMGEFRESRIMCERMLRRDPDSVLARSLLSMVRAKVRSDGVKGLAVVMLVATVAAMAGHLFGSLNRKGGR